MGFENLGEDERFALITNFGDAHFERTNLEGAGFEGANLANARFAHVDLKNTNFLSADLTDASLTNVDFSGANLTDANVARAKIYDPSGLTDDQLRSACIRVKGDSDADFLKARPILPRGQFRDLEFRRCESASSKAAIGHSQ